jgi:hypothetical protein
MRNLKWQLSVRRQQVTVNYHLGGAIYDARALKLALDVGPLAALVRASIFRRDVGSFDNRL